MSRRRKMLDSLLIGMLLLYILAGMTLTPFHGDESSTIYMSRDWYTLVWAHNPSALFYRNPPDPKTATDQQLRLVNGPLAYYITGLAWSMVGLTVNDVNDQWLWGADWDYNHDNGHIPSDRLLFVTRLSSTLLTALSAAMVFVIGRQLAGHNAGRVSAFVYATLPMVLINGRRAMFEGAFLLMIALVIWIGMALARRMTGQIKGEWRWWLLLGLLSGLAIAAKHTAILIVIPVFGTLLLVGGLRRPGYLIGALAIAGITFLILNPAWWGAPLEVPREVLRLRQELLNGQVEHFGGYASSGERLVALITQPLGGPQYYEDRQGWPQWIGGQISAYEQAGPLTVGIAWGWAGAALGAVGLAALVHTTRQKRGVLVFLNVTWFTALALLILTPLAWQRYYVPLAPLWAGLIGTGMITLWRLVRSRYAR